MKFMNVLVVLALTVGVVNAITVVQDEPDEKTVRMRRESATNGVAPHTIAAVTKGNGEVLNQHHRVDAKPLNGNAATSALEIGGAADLTTEEEAAEGQPGETGNWFDFNSDEAYRRINHLDHSAGNLPRWDRDPFHDAAALALMNMLRAGRVCWLQAAWANKKDVYKQHLLLEQKQGASSQHQHKSPKQGAAGQRARRTACDDCPGACVNPTNDPVSGWGCSCGTQLTAACSSASVPADCIFGHLCAESRVAETWKSAQGCPSNSSTGCTIASLVERSARSSGNNLSMIEEGGSQKNEGMLRADDSSMEGSLDESLTLKKTCR